MLVGTRECAKGPVDGVDHNHFVKVYLSVHIVRTFISFIMHCTVFSCMIAYPGTGCTTDIHASLLGSFGNPRCSCHVSCFNYDTCCEDIGCARKCTFCISHDTYTLNDFLLQIIIATAVANTCGQAGMSRGCCSWDSQEGCYVPDGMCYCDSECKIAGDCCADVPSTPTCTACKYMHVPCTACKYMPRVPHVSTCHLYRM